MTFDFRFYSCVTVWCLGNGRHIFGDTEFQEVAIRTKKLSWWDEKRSKRIINHIISGLNVNNTHFRVSFVYVRLREVKGKTKKTKFNTFNRFNALLTCVWLQQERWWWEVVLFKSEVRAWIVQMFNDDDERKVRLNREFYCFRSSCLSFLSSNRSNIWDDLVIKKRWRHWSCVYSKQVSSHFS